MLVDDNQANLNIGKNMLKETYEVYALPSAERLFKFLETVRPDLILLDIAMPGMNGFDVIKILKADNRYQDIPVIFLTAKSEEMNELEGLTLGAVDYVTKPFSSAILSRRIANHLLIKWQKEELNNLNHSLIGMLKDKAGQLSGLQSSVLNIIADIVEFRDALTGGHIYRTQKYVETLLNRILERNIYSEDIMSWENMEYIVASTQLHDLGKIYISDAILNKPGKLTDEEFAVMKTHAEKGAEAIRRIVKTGGDRVFLGYAETVAISHHEKWDGSGYPYGLKELEIPLLGRIMAIADVYDALTQARPYKEPMPGNKAAEIIYSGSGKHFDPVLIGLFREAEDEFAKIAKEE
jgi:putative two-component system response regulator